MEWDTNNEDTSPEPEEGKLIPLGTYDVRRECSIFRPVQGEGKKDAA